MVSEKWIKNSIGLRIVIIGILAFLLMIPSLMIMGLVDEREGRKNEVEQEVSSKWGEGQILTGPILTIPFLQQFNSTDNKVSTRKNYLHLLPENLNVEGKADPIIRYRGIFKVVLYNSRIKFDGQYNLTELEEPGIDPQNILFDETFITLGISDMRGIKDEISLKFDNDIIEGEPGLISKDVIESGISFKAKIKETDRVKQFELSLSLNGSQTIKFIPVGKESNVTMRSAWNNPGFSGEYLPAEREINNDGFTAKWKILHFNRNFPQKWIGDKYKIDNSAFGVDFLFPVDSYRKTQRTVKYAILFIGLTFLAFFIVEILNKKVLHPIQYLLIGIALVLFYSLLLALSEHMAFALAYLVSSLSIISVITFYSHYVLKSSKLALMLGVFISIFYLFLYVLLQLQDYSVLVGSIGLLIILSIVMYVTRNIDWFTVLESNDKKLT